jgi:hypothetical protein
MDDRRAPAAEFVCDRCRLIPRRSGGGTGSDGRGRRRWRVHLHRLRTLRTARLAAGAVAGATWCVIVRGRGTRGACHLQQRQEHRERIERIGPRARAVLGVVAEAAEQRWQGLLKHPRRDACVLPRERTEERRAHDGAQPARGSAHAA